MTRRNTLELWVGFFVTLGIGALAMLAFKVGSMTAGDIKDGYVVTAAFDNIGKLKVKAPVTLAGVRVGRVAGIRLDKERFRAVVEINLDGRYPIPDDSSAAILTSGLLGDQYIGLSPGGSDENLKADSVIHTTASALVLEKLVGEVLFNKAAEGEKK